MNIKITDYYVLAIMRPSPDTAIFESCQEKILLYLNVKNHLIPIKTLHSLQSALGPYFWQAACHFI